MLEAAKKGSRPLTSTSIISSDTPSPASSCEEGDARSPGCKSATRCFMPDAFRNGWDFRMVTRRKHLLPQVAERSQQGQGQHPVIKFIRSKP